MKKHILSLLAFSVLFFAFSACDKDVTGEYAELQALSPASQDLNAGVWKTVVLTTPDEVAVPAPSDVNSAEYQAELAAGKQALAGLSDKQKEIIRYWSAGSVLRWNEIMRYLVAKYNLAPAPNADGTYPVPDASNPFSYPEFPFANPPYSARAYAYASVAQFDALVAGWHFKSLYNRPAPYNVDATIEPYHVAKTSLPSYPLEDAVVAGAAFTMLRALFPADTAFINEKVNEAAWYKQWAGAAVASDVTAGLNLGKSVAAKVLNRAKSDGMKNAIGSKSIQDSLQQRVEALGETSWISLESPRRPGMLMMFGAVKPWLFDPANIESIRPVPPPSVNSDAFKAELEEVKREADPSDREKMRIVHFWADGTGTYTPPGHWNVFAFEEIYNAGQSEVRAARNFALLNMAMMDAAIACWETKYYYMVPRPSQMDPSIKTLTGLPNFPAYTSGHSTFSATGATVLGHLFPSKAATFNAWADEASLSRLYGGIHYRMDCEAGLLCGQVIGGFAVDRARTDGAE
ncbi:MAG: phosphatase PAP2 family protein [Saprospiraceae bacterium]|nr:phosphatase PAP2 family protein [Saprospiraceae bacterium]